MLWQTVMNGLNYKLLSRQIMRTILIFVAIVLFILHTGCEARQVNYLNRENAMYLPDTVVFQSELNPENATDARRIEFKIPWQSGTLQGLEGGFPMRYRIVNIRCEQGYEEARKQFYMDEGDSRVKLPFDHSVPEGKYTFSVEVSNEGGRNKCLFENGLTIIME